MSAVERKPAQRVAQPLVVEHKFSDFVGEFEALYARVASEQRRR